MTAEIEPIVVTPRELWWLYLARVADGTLTIGMTREVRRRVVERGLKLEASWVIQPVCTKSGTQMQSSHAAAMAALEFIRDYDDDEREKLLLKIKALEAPAVAEEVVQEPEKQTYKAKRR